MTKRKRKLRKNRLLVLIVLIFVILLIINTLTSNKNQYSKETNEIIKKNNINNIDNKSYSKTLDEALKSNNYIIDFIKEYEKINYIEKDNFIDNINKYLKIGYNGDEVNNIFKLSELNQQKILNYDKLDFSKYIDIKNFDIDKLDRYNIYLEKNNYNIKDVVTYVNVSIDKPFYTDTVETNDPDSLFVLVNKYNHLPNNYKPSDITYVDGAYGNQVPFRNVLKDSFIKLQQAAKDEININLMPTTAFRNQSFQTTLYNNYVKSDGIEKADTYSARPGYSEHQTGLAIDLKNTALSNTRLTDDNYEWLHNNAYKYGFIIRFPKDKEFITGYQFENWHIRYVGEEAAKIIYDNNLTLEEYIDLYITKY